VIQISSDLQKNQTTQATNVLAEFVRILVKEYPLVFKDESGALKIVPSIDKRYFPYGVSLTIKKKKYHAKKSKVDKVSKLKRHKVVSAPTKLRK